MYFMLDLNQYNFIRSFALLHQKIRQEITENFSMVTLF